MNKSNIASYFEIPVADLERAVDFYSYVFECELVRETIHGNEMALFPFDSGAHGITGALACGEIYKPSKDGALVYLATANIDETMKRVSEKGGAELFPKTKAGEYGSVAEFEDSEGNRVALFEANS